MMWKTTVTLFAVVTLALAIFFPQRSEAFFIPFCIKGASPPEHPATTLLHLLIWTLTDELLYNKGFHTTQVNVLPPGTTVTPNPRTDEFVPLGESNNNIAHGIVPTPLAPGIWANTGISNLWISFFASELFLNINIPHPANPHPCTSGPLNFP